MRLLITLFLTFCTLNSFAGEGSSAGNGGGPGLVQLIKASSFSNLKSEIILEGAVDIRLVSNEVLDIHQLQDRFPGKVLQDGKYLKVSRKLPLSDYQNLSGEVIRLK